MILFVAGIDTGIGKSVATGCLARWYMAQGCTVITQKLVQTGATAGDDGDLGVHRRLMGVTELPEDREGLTCPCTLAFPAAPALAAALEGRHVDLAALAAATRTLAGRYRVVLVEGVGGLCVPLTPEVLAVDYVAERGWPVVLVSGPRLGSINHTLLSLEALWARGLTVAAVIYNLQVSAPPEIVTDTRRTIVASLRRHGAAAPVLDLPPLTPGQPFTPPWEGLPLPDGCA